MFSGAIPLVDPDLRLLPIHFLVDPGENFEWTKSSLEAKKVKLAISFDKVMVPDSTVIRSCKVSSLQMKQWEKSNDEKLQLLRSYLDVVNVPIPLRS